MKKFLFPILMLLFLSVPLMAQDDGGQTSFNVWTVVSAVLGILSAVLGTVVAKAKGKFKKVLNLGQQVIECLVAYKAAGDELSLAAEDNNIDQAEAAKVKAAWLRADKEAGDVRTAWKVLWAKES